MRDQKSNTLDKTVAGMLRGNYVWRVRRCLLIGIFSLGLYGCIATEEPIRDQDALAESAHQPTGSHSALIEEEKFSELPHWTTVEIDEYLQDQNNARYYERPVRLFKSPNTPISDKESIIEDLEQKIKERSSLRDSDEANKAILNWPKEHSKLATLYFSEGKSKEGFHQLEFVALYHFDAGRRLSSYYEGLEDYPKAYLYYALSRYDSRGGYNAEEFRVLYPVIARLSSKLDDDESLWIESEISRHVQTRRMWARQIVDESK